MQSIIVNYTSDMYISETHGSQTCNVDVYRLVHYTIYGGTKYMPYMYIGLWFS